MKTLFAQIDEIYKKLDNYFYDELTDYEKGVKDILNMLDNRMTGNDENEIHDYIMNTISQHHNFDYKYYYQIDYIDENGLANYIRTFTKNKRHEAIEATKLLNQANACINKDTYYVLDCYRFKIDKNGNTIDDTEEIIEKDIKE